MQISDSAIVGAAITGVLGLVGVVVTAVIGFRSKLAEDTTRRIELLMQDQNQDISDLRGEVKDLRGEVEAVREESRRWRSLLDIALANIRSWVAWNAGGRHGEPPGVRDELVEHLHPGPHPREPPDTS